MRRQTTRAFYWRGTVSLLLSMLVWSLAVAESPSRESQIAQARELVLSGKRLEALKRLRIALRGRNGEPDPKVERAAAEISQTFLSEKANSQYAVAESTWLGKPREALEILQSLVGPGSPEPAGNNQIVLLAARAAIRLGECSRAQSLIRLAEETWRSTEATLLSLQAQVCVNGASVSAPEVKAPETGDWSELAVQLKLVLIQDALRRKDLKTARAQIALIEGQAQDNPELWHLRWRAFGDRADGRRYVRLCSELTPKRKERFKTQPDLCLAVESVESELKSGEKSGS